MTATTTADQIAAPYRPSADAQIIIEDVIAIRYRQRTYNSLRSATRRQIGDEWTFVTALSELVDAGVIEEIELAGRHDTRYRFQTGEQLAELLLVTREQL